MTQQLQTPPGVGGRITLVHVSVISLSLMLTLGAWMFSKHQVDTRTGLQFEAARDRAVGLISDRMAKYEDALWAGVAGVESHGGDMSRQQWQVFARNLNIDERYPGINGIGVIHFLNKSTLADYIAEQRQTKPDFRVFPDHEQIMRMPITYIHPEATNAAAVGLDVAHERNRRAAAIASRDTGTAQITGPIVLVQDVTQTPGFLFYAPFYEGGPQPNVESRRARAIGAVYAPFVVHKLMEGLLAKELRDVRFSIRDSDALIYDEHSQPDPQRDPDPMFAEEVTLDLYGRNWTLDMRTTLSFRAQNTKTQPTMILIGGLLIETLIVSLLLLMARANHRAYNYANVVTTALRAEKAKLVTTNTLLSRKNEELERFTYVASHDLKTPIRGISSLTEMIEEDLEPYLSDPTANPDVAENLDRIKERVGRMEELTKGIMAISRLDVDVQQGPPIALEEVLSELLVDFRLTPDKLKLAGDATRISTDQANFRSVIENLVGNAIKYHDGVKPLRIDVTAEQRDGRVWITVTDNGPGIDAMYHERIFDVFQTLRTDNGAESTGIGLAIVKKAVECHGGTVDLSSTPGEGASFTFDWPATRASDTTDCQAEAA